MGKFWRLACGCCEHGSVVGFADDFGLGYDLGFVRSEERRVGKECVP